MVTEAREIRVGYKMSKFGLIPNEWEDQTIGELIKFEGGQQPPRKYFINEEKEGFIRLIQIRDYKTDKYKTYIPIEMAKRFCDETDIMIGRYGPPIFQILRGIKGAYNVALIKAIPKSKLLKEYAYYYLCTDQLFNLIERLSQRTSGQTGVDMDALKDYPLPLPPLKEQQKIAEILSNVDEQIENTDRLIIKTKELKNGLMQRLLTKGIGHTRFKQTELGEIPFEWEVKQLSQVADIRGGKRLPKGKTLLEDPTSRAYIRVSDMFMGGVMDSNILYVPEDVIPSIERYRIFEGELFISVAGTLGLIGEIPKSLDGANLTENADRICNLKCNKTFLKYYLMSDLIQNVINNEKTKNAQPKLALTRIKTFKIPGNKEQQKIAEILSTVDDQIESYEQEKEKYNELKKGLMQQLLTGKIRVTV